jgi:hypothetical protein
MSPFPLSIPLSLAATEKETSAPSEGGERGMGRAANGLSSPFSFHLDTSADRGGFAEYEGGSHLAVDSSAEKIRGMERIHLQVVSCSGG